MTSDRRFGRLDTFTTRGVAAGLSCAAIAGCSAPAGTSSEPVATTRSALVFATEQINGTVSFTNAAAPTVSVLDTVGICGGNVVATSTGPTSPSPALIAASALSAGLVDGGPSELTASYQLTVDAPDCPATLDYGVAAGINLCLPAGGSGSYFIPPVAPPATNGPVTGLCQNPDQSDGSAPDAGENGPISHPITDCAAILDITFNAPVNASSVQTYHPLVSALMGGGSQSWGNFVGPLTDAKLPVRGDGSQVLVNAFYTTGTDDFSDTIKRLCQFKNVTANCDEIIPLTCDVTQDGSDTELGSIVGVIDMVGEYENYIVGDKRTRVFGSTGPFDNVRYFWVPQNPSPSTESPPSAFANESSGPFVLQNLLESSASIPITSTSTPWPVWGDMSVRKGVQAEYFSSPQLADVSGTPNAAVTVPAGPAVDLGNTFVMKPGYLQGSVLFQGSPTPTSCVKNIYRASDGQPPSSVPPDWSLGGSSFIAANGDNQIASSTSVHTALGGAARVNFDAAFDSVGGRFLGPTVEPTAYQMALGILSPDTQALWNYTGVQLIFFDPQRLGAGSVTDPATYQNAQVNIVDANPTPLVITAGGSVTKNVAYCFNGLTINYVNDGASGGSGAFVDPAFTIGAGSFSGTDFQGNNVSYNVGGQAYGTPASAFGMSAQTDGGVYACLPQGTYDLNPVVTASNSGGGTSSTALPPLVGVSLGCGTEVSITPPLVVTGSVPACVTRSAVPVSAIVSSSNPQQPQIPIDDVVVSVTTEQADGGADAGLTVTSFGSLCGGADAGAPGSCGSGNPGACGCTVSPPLAGTITVGQCRSSVTVTARSTEGGQTKTSSDTRTVVFDPSAPTLSCPDLTVSLPTGQTSVPVSYSLGVNDACLQDVVVTCDTPSGESLGAGTTNVHCTATNGCQQTSCTFAVNVASGPPSCPVASEWSSSTTYKQGDKVTYGGLTFEARQSSTGYPPTLPGTSGALDLWGLATPCGITAWAPDTHYLMGSMVTYGNQTYICTSENWADPGWTPAATLGVLWTVADGQTPLCLCK